MASIRNPGKPRSPMSDPNMMPADLLQRSGTSDPLAFIRIGIAAAKEKKYERALVFLAEAYNRLTKTPEANPADAPGASPAARAAVPAIALSYYGLCLALQRRQYQQGAAFCELAISAERSVSEHYQILSRIWRERGNDEKAMDAVKRGLAACPGSRSLQTLQGELKRSHAPDTTLMAHMGSLGSAVGRLIRQFKREPKAGPAPGSGSRKKKSGETRRPR